MQTMDNRVDKTMDNHFQSVTFHTTIVQDVYIVIIYLLCQI